MVEKVRYSGYTQAAPGFGDLALMLELDLFYGRRSDFRRRLRRALATARKRPKTQKRQLKNH